MQKVRRADRTKKRKYRKSPSGTKAVTSKKKTGKHRCNLCRSIMHGMPHGKRAFEVGKMGKTQKRPTALFAGKLCNRCRGIAVEEAIKVKEKAKKIGARGKELVKDVFAPSKFIYKWQKVFEKAVI